MVTDLLSQDEARAYWDTRHQVEGELRSGGHVGLGPEANRVFYTIRLGKLLELIGGGTGSDGPLFVLDAGCGKGYFAGFLAGLGHEVTGIDTSRVAVEFSRQRHAGTYEISAVADHRAAWLYDVIYAVDVLFHILNDAEWEASIRNLASLVRLGGRLIVTDLPVESRQTLGDYIVHRPMSDYDEVLAPLGFKAIRQEPYGFRDNRIEFWAYGRVG